MDLVAKLPALEDTALAVLHSNAERLEQTGTSAQKTAASAIIPAIEAELSARRAAKLAASRSATKTVSSKRSAKPKG
jgi:hypothetical protein